MNTVYQHFVHNMVHEILCSINIINCDRVSKVCPHLIYTPSSGKFNLNNQINAQRLVPKWPSKSMFLAVVAWKSLAVYVYAVCVPLVCLVSRSIASTSISSDAIVPRRLDFVRAIVFGYDRVSASWLFTTSDRTCKTDIPMWNSRLWGDGSIILRSTVMLESLLKRVLQITDELMVLQLVAGYCPQYGGGLFFSRHLALKM